jgi:hypothetical protein
MSREWSVSEAKRQKSNPIKRNMPAEGSLRRRIYDCLILNGEYQIPHPSSSKEYSLDSCTLMSLGLFYGVETANCGGGKYRLLSY